MTKLKFPNLWLTIGFLLVLAVIGASLMPHPPHVAHFRNSDKVGHFAAYVAMTFWFGQIYARNLIRVRIALAFVVLGVTLECLQRLSGFRTFEYADMAANGAGVLCALILVQTRFCKALAAVERSLLRFIKRPANEPSTILIK
jgi:VanZ family protein